MKRFIYNFNGTTYETTEAFDDTYRAMKKEAEANGEPFSRQIVYGDGRVVNERYCHNSIWLSEK